MRNSKMMEMGGQTLMDLEGLETTEKMPVCDMTGTNVDLHLVAYEDPDTGSFTAGILGADYRHLVRRTTTLSIPIWVLSLGTIRNLEQRKKIPSGSKAADVLRDWLRHGVDLSWKELAESKPARQERLELDDVSGLGF